MPDNSFIQPIGGARQTSFAPADLGIPAATVLPASGTVAGALLQNTSNLKTLAVSATASQAGNVILTTYLDLAGSFVLETVTVPVTAGGNATAVTTKLPFASFRVSVQNGGATAGTCGVNTGLGQA